MTDNTSIAVYNKEELTMTVTDKDGTVKVIDYNK